MQLLKLVQDQVRLGEPLPWNVRDGIGNLLLAQGRVVASEAQRTALIERGAFVDADEVRAVEEASRKKAVADEPPPSLFNLWGHVVFQLQRLLKSGNELGFANRTMQLTRHISELTERDPDVAIYLTVRQERNDATLYGVAHAMHTATVCHLMARRMGWSVDQASTLMKAALTMNISIVELQGHFAAEGDPPTAAQRDILRNHTVKSVEMLTSAGVNEPDWIAAVAHHHERSDGTGHPQGIREVPELALALRHTDVFLAKISPRKMRAALPIQQAARELFQESAGNPVAAVIIKELGIYPPGDFVKLKSGELAVVIRRATNVATPLVASITNRQGVPIVATVQRDTAKSEFAIVSTVSDKRMLLRIQPERLYGLPE